MNAVLRTRRFEARRDAIVEASVRMFNQHGVKGVTLADIAREVGLATNSVTYYYRRKEDIAAECFLRSIAVYERLAVEAAARSGEVRERLAWFFAEQARMMADEERGVHPPLMRFSDLRALPERLAAGVFKRFEEMFRAVRGMLVVPASGRFTRAQFNGRAHLVLTMCHWLRGWSVRAYETDQYAWVAEQVVDLLVHGLAARKARWKRAAGRPAWELGGTPSESVAQAFLRAATELINEQGYRGASVEKISARLNVTKGSFYHHIERKDDLVGACFERSFAVLRLALARAAGEPGNGWDKVHAAASELVRFQLSDEGPLLRSSAATALPERARRSALRIRDHLAWQLRCLLVQGMQDGSIRPVDSVVAAYVLLEAINAAAELRRWVPGATMDSAVPEYLHPMLGGLLAS